MAEIKVSQLPEATQINDEDLLMIVQGNTNKKITKANAKFASGDEIFVGDTLPSGEDADSIKLWLTDDDALEGEGNYISNEYGTSQEIGYSQEYVNNNYFSHKVLYSSSGSNGTIQLNDSASNYDYIEIFYRTDDNVYSSTKASDGQTVMLQSISTLINNSYRYNVNLVNATISGDTITPSTYFKYNIDNAWGMTAGTQKNDIYITKVVGYK